MAGEINFFKEGVTFRLLNSEKLKKWIIDSVRKEGKTASEINFIFCNDRYLRKMNKEYLQHDYNTDVITFDNSESKDKISGDIFISIERIKVNAKEYSSSFSDELIRVMIHGVLHLCGYDDANEKLKAKMRGMENYYLGKRKFL